MIAAYIATVLAAYLLGSIPTGYLAGRVRGLDVRAMGSGNIGATNVFRVLGKKAGTIVLLVDAAKGFVAARWLPLLTVLLFPNAAHQWEGLVVCAGVAAILGHNFTCWLQFKGGKGIATTAGVVLAWEPMAALTALAVWGLITLATRFVSVASIVAALVLPFAVWYWDGTALFIWVMAGLSLMAIYKHKGNIRRLRDGTESRICLGRKIRP